MKTDNLKVIELDNSVISEIVLLTKHLNPELSQSLLTNRQLEMFSYHNHKCFGLYLAEKLIGVSSGWLTTRLYSGKQLEIDNFIINPKLQSKGYGAFFLKAIEKWSLENNCLTVELNTYIRNERSHSFYTSLGYIKLGYHFQKKID